MDNNPNMIELLFTPDDCVTHSTDIGMLVRDNRHIFLHKGSFFRFKGFAYSQISKMRKKDRSEERLMKYGYHACRLLLEAEQILKYRDIDLRAHSELLQMCKSCEWSVDEVIEWFDDKLIELEEIFELTSALPERPNQSEIKGLLLDCLEEYYGSLEGCVCRT